MKTYFLASSIQNIIQNKQHFMNNEEEIELKVFAKDTDYDEKCNAIAVESFTGQSWIITESFKGSLRSVSSRHKQICNY